MPELTTELQRMADEAASQARPLAAAEIFRQGDRRRRRSFARQSLGGLSAAGVVGAGVALGLGLTGSAPAHGTGTIQTAAFTLVSNANGTATLTINTNVVFEPGTLQRDLADDGIPAKITVGSFCSSDPAPAGINQVVSIPKIPRSGLATQPPLPLGSKPRHVPERTMTINPAQMPAGTELSFGNFPLASGEQTVYALIDTSSFTCASTAPATPPPGGGEFSFSPGHFSAGGGGSSRLRQK
jgi:hypothetical protein